MVPKRKHAEMTKMDSGKKMWSAVISTPFGRMGIRTTACMTMLDETNFLPADTPVLNPAASNLLAHETVEALKAYFINPSFEFKLPLAPKECSQHQQRVWNAMCATPVGQVKTYGEIARAIGSAAQAVGGACGSNHFSILIPCHRVVSGTGIGGFCGRNEDGWQRDIKKWLLNHEGATVKGKK